MQRFTTGEQPCAGFLRGDADVAALGPGNRMNLHQCPKCEGNRAWCDNCQRDHHDGGWETCKPGAYVEPPDPDDDDDPRCTCRLESVHSAMIDPPEMILDPWCPVHGRRDPDEERQRAIDDAAWDRDIGGWDDGGED